MSSQSPRGRRHPPAAPLLVLGTPYTESEFNAYCDGLLSALGLGEGDVIGVELTRSSQRVYVEKLIERGFEIGVEVVSLEDDDGDVATSKLNRVMDERGVVMQIQTLASDNDQATVDNIDGSAWDRYSRGTADNSLRWSISMWPSQDWAEVVYPDLPPEEAYRQLGQDLSHFARSDDQSWLAHMETLHRRADFLNDAEIDEITMTGPGTSLSMRVLPGAQFLPCDWKTKDGEFQVSCNVPTDEVFITPDPNTVEGVFQSTRPLVLGGHVFESVSGEFREGKLIKIEGLSPDETEALRDHFILSDRGQEFIGELGLVDPRGRIGQNGNIFYNNIIDENAGSHIGLGYSYAISSGENQGNQGSGHNDIIFGGPEVDISGRSSSGKEVPIVKDGEWVADGDKI